MTHIRASLTLVAAAALMLADVSAQVSLRTFDDDPIGSVPPGLTFPVARQQAAAKWSVHADGSSRYLAHAADPSAPGGLSLAILDIAHPSQMRVSVRLKLVDGERVGGLVWRYHDQDNFYLTSLDLRLQELALYRIVRGNRIRLDDEDELELDTSAWHSVRVVQDDDDIRVSIGGIGVMRARDLTFTEGGRAGVWSGGGGTAWFDDFRVEPEDDRRGGRGRTR